MQHRERALFCTRHRVGPMSETEIRSRQKEIVMLKLSRRIGETVVLELPTGEQIDVVLLEVKGSQARLAFDAPLDVRIVREELLIGDQQSR